MLRFAQSLFLVLVVFVGVAAAQVTPILADTLPVDYKVLLSNLANSVIIVGLVQLLKTYWPSVRESYPWLIPIVATALGPLIGVLQVTLLGKFGINVDFSPVLAIFSGAAATTVHQVNRQLKKS